MWRIGKKGFTLIELLVVVIIIGIITTGVLISFRGFFQGLEVEGFIKDLFYLCNYLQGSSVAKGKIHSLTIDTQKQQFVSFVQEETSWIPLTSRWARISRTPEQLRCAMAPEGKMRVLFFPDGHIENFSLMCEDKAGKKVSLISEGVVGALKVK
ncbi:MAG: prepilin-type N-terminal cleavage/methylation domain-containing protein [Candidatus Omnitrophica bacterium]|nr:prepilin-type N-terminal cleavage/methylation domain-containing protein [Candidatus Omnitrophota bacterium]